MDLAEVAITEAFEQLPTWRTKCNLIASAAEKRLTDELATELNKLLGSFDGVQKRRNNVVHGRWFMPKDETVKGWVRRKTAIGPSELWDSSCFIQLAGEVGKALTDLLAIYLKIQKHLKDASGYASLAQMILNAPSPDKSDNAGKG